jgi:hypothetical protein
MDISFARKLVSERGEMNSLLNAEKEYELLYLARYNVFHPIIAITPRAISEKITINISILKAI